MLAAIISTEAKVWFFKLMGPASRVEAEVDAFRQLVGSITFAAAEANPEWQLPAGWSTQPGSGMRFATLRTDAGDVSVISLPAPQDIEANIERWRGQLRLPPQPADETSERIPLGRYEAVLVDLIGETDSSKLMTPPFANRARPPAGAAAATTPGGDDRAAGFTYELPDGWRLGRAGGMRRAAFTIGPAGESAEMTVITLTGQAGTTLANVNRWRGQIGLDPIDQPALDETLEQREVSGLAAEFIELTGPADSADPQAILLTMVRRDDVSWFFKLMGPAELVLEQQANFLAFMQSVKIP